MFAETSVYRILYGWLSKLGSLFGVLNIIRDPNIDNHPYTGSTTDLLVEGFKRQIIEVEASKLEHHSPPALKVKYRGSQHYSS